MVIRVEQGKGRKDRRRHASPVNCSNRSARLVAREAARQGWLFPGRVLGAPLTTRQLNRACHAAAQMAPSLEKPVAGYAAPQLRHASSGTEHRHPGDRGLLGRQARPPPWPSPRWPAQETNIRTTSPLDQLIKKKKARRPRTARDDVAVQLEVARFAAAPLCAEPTPADASLGQLKVMSAIESCRTAALGGHVERCEDCAHTRIADNRRSALPEVSSNSGEEWLAEREAELLPAAYYHVVFTLPAPISDIAYQNKSVIYDLLFEASAETLITIAADLSTSGPGSGSLLYCTWVGAQHTIRMCTSSCQAVPLVDGKNWISCRPASPAGSRALVLVVIVDKADGRSAQGRPPQVLRRSYRARQPRRIRHLSGAITQDRVGGLRQEAIRRTEAVLAYNPSRYTHRVAIANSRLIALDAPASPSSGRTIALKAREVQTHDARRR